MKITKELRVTAIVDRTIVYEVPQDIWDELVEFHSCTPEEALDIIIDNDDETIVKVTDEIDEVVMEHHSSIAEH